MSIQEIFPGDPGGEAVQEMASLLAAVALVSIEPFGSDNHELVGLPRRPLYPAADPLPVTQLSVTQDAYNAGVKALGLIKQLEDAIAGCKARMVSRVAGAAAVEADLLSLDHWQKGISASSAVTEMALTLGIPERSAAGLEHHSTALVEQRPQVLAALESGRISWRHATIINNEIETLEETPSASEADAAALEARLLVVSENTTANTFAGKARREREKMHPETIKTRTKDAFTKRNLSCDSGKDGMSWLTLHLPSISASGIYTRCTRLARALKADAAKAQREADKGGTGQDCLEHRTLDQLRADIAAILLMGQDLPLYMANAASTGSPAAPEAGGGNSTQDGNLDDEDPPWAHSSQPEANNATGSGTSSAESTQNSEIPTSEGTTAPSDENPVAGSLATQSAGDATADEPYGDGSGLVGWTVDGLPEDPHSEYRQQLEETARSGIMIDPPLPEALVIVTVPFLALLGLTDEPAELVGPEGGPVPADIARKLLKNASSFLRVLTDPISSDALPLDPQRYTLRAADKAVLQSLSGSCYVPNCPNPVMDTDLDHLLAFEFGGASTMANLRPACKRHHHMKHFKDDKNRHGERRSIDEPERADLKLRGWTPQVTEDGRIGWIMPSGTYQPPQNKSTQQPHYPKWLKKLVDKSLRRSKESHG